MRLRWINPPKRLTEDTYRESMEKAVDILIKLEGILAIYQLGGIGHPGISDIDLLVVFEDTTRVDYDPSQGLCKINPYLFAHELGAISKSHFKKTGRFAVWYKPLLIWGNQQVMEESTLTAAQREALQKQTALEFLIENYIDLTVQLKYGVIKLRSTLQHIKAMRLDLELLGISAGSLQEMIRFLIRRLDFWFENPIQEKDLGPWLRSYFSELETFLGEKLQESPFYLPPGANFELSRNISIANGRSLGHRYSGFSLPSSFMALNKKLFNANMRLNSLIFEIPLTDIYENPIVEERYDFYRQLKLHGVQYYPHFSPLITAFSHKILGS